MNPVERAEVSKRLAEALVGEGHLSEEEAQALLAEAVGQDRPLHALLVAKGRLPAAVVLAALGRIAMLPVVDLASERPSPEALATVPEPIARDFGAVGFRLDGGQLTLAFAEPPSGEDLRTLSTLLGYPVAPVLADPVALERVQVAVATASAPRGAVGSAPAAPGAGGAVSAVVEAGNGQAGAARGVAGGVQAQPAAVWAGQPAAVGAAQPATAYEAVGAAQPAPAYAAVGAAQPAAVWAGQPAAVGAAQPATAYEAVGAAQPAPAYAAVGAAQAPSASAVAGTSPSPTTTWEPTRPPATSPTPPSGAPSGAPPGAAAAGSPAASPPKETGSGSGVAPTGGSLPLHIDDLLRYAVSVGASDLHLTAQMPACIRLNGAIRPIEGCPRLSNETIRDMIFGILPASQRERFEEEKELDTSHAIAGVGRFRVNVFRQRGTVAAVLRSIPHEIPSFESLGIPQSIRSFTELRRGLVLVTGPTGSGKSTTLATLIDIINRSKPLHIVTIEDPIEFLHTHKRSIVNQREVGEDTKSFSEALRRVLREDPDVILVGEMRDLETISMALTAAETGHLVFATLHTQDAPQTVDRIIDVFPPNQQEQVRTQLAATLEGVVTQQLILNAEGTGRLAACEVMVCTAAIRNLIRTAKTHQIYSLMQTGAQYGMQTMDQGLAKLVREGRITEAVAFDRCRSEEDLRNHLAGG
jgi:twitching motility protein PilT